MSRWRYATTTAIAPYFIPLVLASVLITTLLLDRPRQWPLRVWSMLNGTLGRVGLQSTELAQTAAARLAVLSSREREAALLLAEGHSNKAVAARLGVTQHTARRHTERVLRRLGLTSRQQVAPLLLLGV